MNPKIAIAIAMSGLALSASATEQDFTYNESSAESKLYGFNKKESYDVAIKIDDPAIVGSRVTGLTVELPVSAEAVSDISGWIASELKLENKKNVADLASKAGTLADNVLTVTFDSPQTIGGNGLWVGYSFTITALGEEYGYPGAPVAVVASDDNTDKGLWMHTSRTRLKWADIGSLIGAVSTMTVHLDADFGPADAAVSIAGQTYIVSGRETTVPVKIINHGAKPLESVDYTYVIGSVSETGTLRLAEPLATRGGSANVQLPVKPVAENGEYDFSLTLDKSNGEANTDPNRSATSRLNVWPFIPVTRPLVEEYTGLGCGWCPRGYVAMEYMKETLGDRFVGMAFHSEVFETEMATVRKASFPFNVSGYPFADINRIEGMDPSRLPFKWDGYAAEVVPAAIDLTADWADDNKAVKLTASLIFAKDIAAADYRLAFAITGDNLHNANWAQHNYYSDETEGEGVESPLWDIFVAKEDEIEGLIYNDVVVCFKDIPGVAGSVPSTVKCGETITRSYTYNVADFKTLRGRDFLNPEAQIRGVVMLIDGKTGHVVNSNRSALLPYADAAGIKAVEADTPVVATTYYNLQGVKTDASARGLRIRAERLSDGTLRTVKELR